jgi:S-(hydroxymethyl)glutathione dehydrogenase/alcohol dehydrogenase
MTSVGAFADRVVVPGSTVIPIPDGLSMREAALVGCAALTGVGAVTNAARVAPGARAVVIGAGGIGQFVIQALRLAGADIIAAVDPSEPRRARARTLGATHAVAPEALAGVIEELGGRFEFAFEAVGSAATTQVALTATDIGGTTTLIGMAPAGAEVTFDPLQFIVQEKVLLGSMYGSADPSATAKAVLADVERGALELGSMLGPSFALEDVNLAIEAALSGEEGRVTILPRDAP